jgi:hypothetical protein
MVSPMLHGAGIFWCRTVEGLDIVIPSNWIVMITFYAHIPWCWYIYLQNRVILFGQMLVSKYSSTIEHMGL